MNATPKGLQPNQRKEDRPLAASRQRPGTATYQRGQITAANILEQARQLAIDEGLSKLSMRGLARQLNISPGNLSYYYASKSDLIEDLIAYVLQPYLDEFARLRASTRTAPQQQLRAVLEFVYDDLQERRTTLFFPELWAMSLRDATIAAQMEHMYSTYRAVLADLIAQIRPDLHQQQVDDVSLTLSATIEGFTVFTGHGRLHTDRATVIKPLVIEQLINTVLTTEPVYNSGETQGIDHE